MRDQNTRAMLIEAVIAGGLIAIGIPTGQPLLALAAAATSVGCNWTHSLAERGFQHWSDRWFTDDGVLNHDISRALCHAFVNAVRQVEHDWKKHPYYQYLERKKPEEAKLTMTALRLLREDGATLFQQPHQLAQITQQEQHEHVLSLLNHDKFKAREYLKPALDAFLDSHDDQFVTFVTDQLGSKWILRFLEILKDPGEEGTRAWRACQLLWQKSLILGINQVQQTTAETADAVHWLKEWAQQLQSQPPTQRNSTGQDALEGILHSLHVQLDEMQETLDKTYATTLDIKAALEQVYSKGGSSDSAPDHIWTVPYRRNPFFTGREQVFAFLNEKLTSTKSVALTQTQAISGLGGIGKTQTAIEYAYRYRDNYRIILWIKADTPETLISDFIAIAHLLNLPEKDAQDQQLIVNAVKNWLEVSPDWLLILDNADDLSIIQSFLPTAGKGHILLTTRARPTGKLAQRIELDKMGMEEGILFLLRRADIIVPDASLEAASAADRVQAHELVTLMDGLPLALDQAGAYIEETGTDLSHYLKLYKTRREELLKRRSIFPTDHPEPVASTWSLSFQRLEKLNPVGADLLCVCAFLQPDAIPEELLTEGAPELGNILAPIASDPLQLDEAVADLLRFSLVRRHPESKTLSVHRLVQVTLKDEMEEQTQRFWAERVIRAVNRAFPKRDKVKTWSDWQRYVPHALACAELIEQLKIILPEAARLLRRAGIYLYNYNRSDLQEAEILLKQAVPVSEQALGREHSETIECFHVLTLLYRMQDCLL